jgi:hypothetical protein
VKRELLLRSRLRLRVRLLVALTLGSLLGLVATSASDAAGVRPILFLALLLGSWSLYRQVHALLHVLSSTSSSPWPARLWRPSRAQARERFDVLVLTPAGRASAVRGYLEGRDAGERLLGRIGPGTDIRVGAMMAARLAALALAGTTGEPTRVCSRWLEDPEVTSRLEVLARA